MCTCWQLLALLGPKVTGHNPNHNTANTAMQHLRNSPWQRFWPCPLLLMHTYGCSSLPAPPQHRIYSHQQHL
jgi:hypothetical protein